MNAKELVYMIYQEVLAERDMFERLSHMAIEVHCEGADMAFEIAKNEMDVLIKFIENINKLAED